MPPYSTRLEGSSRSLGRSAPKRLLEGLLLVELVRLDFKDEGDTLLQRNPPSAWVLLRHESVQGLKRVRFSNGGASSFGLPICSSGCTSCQLY